MASITYTLPRFPLLNQRTEASNPNDDCVFTSNAAIVRYFYGGNITGSDIKAKDADYGPKYVGFASQSRILDTMASLGVRFARVAHPTQADLITELHRQISYYHQPCIITMPSQWNSAPTTVKGYNPRTYNGYSHVSVMCGSGPSMLRAMNPWGGFWQDQPDSWWAQRLLYGEIWVGVYRPIVPVVAPVQATPAPSPAPTGVSTATTSTVVTVADLQAKIATAIKALS